MGFEGSQYREQIRDFLAPGVGLDRTVNRDVFPTLDLEVFQKFARDFPRLLEEIASGEFESCAVFLAKFISSQLNSNGIVVLNNGPPAHYFSSAASIPCAMAVVVTREIRDTLSDCPPFKTKQGFQRALCVFEHALRLRWHQESLKNLRATWLTSEEFVLPAENGSNFSSISLASNRQIVCLPFRQWHPLKT